MDTFSQRESVLLGYSPQSSFINHTSSPKTPYIDSDVDFNDVFGGPPRRSSIPEMRYSFSETTDSPFSGDNEAPRFRSPWSGLIEKPVFGEEIGNRRRYPSDDFFDDIFRSDESVSSTPRKNSWDPFASSPGSRVLSPVRPLPPKTEPFVSSSVPAQFSLPPKLTEGMDLPTFGNCSLYNKKDGASNGISYSNSPSTSLSRFSSQAIQRQEESRNDVQSSSYHQSRLSNEFSLSSEGSSSLTKSDKTDTGSNLKGDSNGMEVTINSNQFHFSIYKWASKGVSLLMPLSGANSSRLKQMRKTERCSSTNGRIESESMAGELATRTPCNTDFPSTANVAANTKSFSKEHAEQENNSLLDTEDRLEPSQIVEEAVFPRLESETPRRLKGTVEDVPRNTLLCNTGETASHFLPEIISSEKSSVVTQEAHKPESKPLRSLLYDNDDERGNDEKTGKAGGEEITVNKKSSVNVDVGKNVKKLDVKNTSLNNAEDNKASLQGSPMNSRDKLERNRVKGKVKEFVKIFNQEASSKQKLDVDSRNQSSRWKDRSTFRPESGARVSTTRAYEKIHMPDVNTKTTLPYASVTADEDHKQSEEQQYTTANYIFSDISLKQKDISLKQKDSSGSGTASIFDGFKGTVVDTDESFQGDFLVKELPQDENELPPIGEDPEDIQVADAKIRHWSKGKEGNIRSLLSTLHYVLWPESGWKPVPLVDIIEGNAVKRAYQKALLRLHPDKLQQKGAALHQKYIAEKVFDILQEAWTHFNTLSSL